MPHALQIFSDAYKRVDPVFSKRSRQLLRSLERCRVSAQKTAAAGEPGADMFSTFTVKPRRSGRGYKVYSGD